MTDLFEYATAVAARNVGMQTAAEAQGDAWAADAYAAIVSVARRQLIVHVDDVLKVFHRQPEHYNAWGAVWMKAIRQGILRRTGTVRPCKAHSRKHAHQYPVYASAIYAG